MTGTPEVCYWWNIWLDSCKGISKVGFQCGKRLLILRDGCCSAGFLSTESQVCLHQKCLCSTLSSTSPRFLGASIWHGDCNRDYAAVESQASTSRQLDSSALPVISRNTGSPVLMLVFCLFSFPGKLYVCHSIPGLGFVFWFLVFCWLVFHGFVVVV